jgi:hypothetical protein
VAAARGGRVGSGPGRGGRVLLGRGRLRADRAPLAGAGPDRRRGGRPAGLRAASAGAPRPGKRGLHPQQERRDRRDDHRPAGHRAALLPARARRTGLGPTAAPRRPSGRPGHRRHRRPPAGHGPARMCVAGGAAGRRQANEIQELAGRDHGAAGPGRRQRRPESDPPLGLDPVRRRGPPRASPPRRHPLVLQDRAGRLRRRGRPGPGRSRRGQPARRRSGADPGSRWPTWPTPAPRPPSSRPGWSRCSTGSA